MSKSKQLSFVADEETLALIEKLKEELGAKTTTGVFRKALALAKIAAERAEDSDHVVTIRGEKAPAEEAVNVALRV